MKSEIEKFGLNRKHFLLMNYKLLISISLIGLFIYVLFYDGKFHSNYIIVSVLAIIPLTFHLIATLNYFLEHFNKKVLLNSQSNEIEIWKRNKKIQINKKDIYSCYVVECSETTNLNHPFYNCKYLGIQLNDGKLHFITCLTADPIYLCTKLNVNFQLIERKFPLIDYRLGSGKLSKKQYDLKVEEYYELFKNKSKHELLEISKNPKVYADYAIEGAKRNLDKIKINKST